MVRKVIILFAFTAIVIVVLINGHPLCTQCPNSYGHVINCSLVSPNELIHSQPTISQLQCFDMCLRQPGCEFYNYIKKEGNHSCQTFSGLWSFDDQEKVLLDPGATFTWIARDRYLQWLSPDCPGVDCLASNDSALIGSCKKPLDIAFLLDKSTHTEDDFKREKEFVSKVIRRFEQSARYTKAAIVEYNTNATVTYSFNNFTTPADFQNYLLNIPMKAGGTRYDRALHLAETRLFSSQGGARPFAHRAVVLFTNSGIGDSVDDEHKSLELKKSYNQKCIQLFAVGIGNGRDSASEVATDDHLLKVEYYWQLEAQANQFSNRICTAFN